MPKMTPERFQEIREQCHAEVAAEQEERAVLLAFIISRLDGVELLEKLGAKTVLGFTPDGLAVCAFCYTTRQILDPCEECRRRLEADADFFRWLSELNRKGERRIRWEEDGRTYWLSDWPDDDPSEPAPPEDDRPSVPWWHGEQPERRPQVNEAEVPWWHDETRSSRGGAPRR